MDEKNKKLLYWKKTGYNAGCDRCTGRANLEFVTVREVGGLALQGRDHARICSGGLNLASNAEYLSDIDVAVLVKLGVVLHKN